VELSDGDVITLGGGVSMTVHIFAAVRGSYGEDAEGLVFGNSPDDELSDASDAARGHHRIPGAAGEGAPEVLTVSSVAPGGPQDPPDHDAQAALAARALETLDAVGAGLGSSTCSRGG
jgi:hypothetical protein